MTLDLVFLVLVLSFGLVALASRQVGFEFRRLRLPLITGFLCTGILAGPHLLNLIGEEAVGRLRFVDEISLAFIAFAAGAEFHLRSMQGRIGTILKMTLGLVLATFLLGSLGFYLLSTFLEPLVPLAPMGRLAVAFLAGSILIARSPSSAIAIIDELRAKGPFTRTVLGVTVIMDVVVIVWFSGTVAFADAVLTEVGLSPAFVALLLGELFLSTLLGLAVAATLFLILATPLPRFLKTGLVLVAGFAVYALSEQVRRSSGEHLSFEIVLEPLFICMLAGFTVSNFTRHRNEFGRILRDAGPPVYVLFFTLAGASLQLDQLLRMWPVALAIFGVRLAAITLGATAGGVISRLPARHTRVSWMAFITQAGVGLGLAKEVALEFPEWGQSFATLLIAVIVLNQVLGPPLLKWAIHLVGEAHERGHGEAGDRAPNRVVIFGLESQSLALARQLQGHGWEATIVCRRPGRREAAEIDASDLDIRVVEDLTLASLKEVGAHRAGAIVTLLPDEENYQVCSLAYENFGTETLVVRLDDRRHLQLFHKLGALVVDPPNAIVSLLDHFVRSPTATSLLLGIEGDQDLVDLFLRNPDLEGVPLRDLDLPLDTLVVSVRREDHTLSSHGYTRLRRGDRITVLGSPESLVKAARIFGG